MSIKNNKIDVETYGIYVNYTKCLTEPSVRLQNRFPGNRAKSKISTNSVSNAAYVSVLVVEYTVVN